MIINKQGKFTRMSHLYWEQLVFLKTYLEYRKILVLKARQVRISTITGGALFHDAWMSPDPINTLCVAHESGAVQRVNQMWRTFVRGLPPELRPTMPVDNSKEIQLGHNESTFAQLLAGGRGGGRSKSYQRTWWTEMAFYPRGSAASGTKGDSSQPADVSLYASVMSTMPEDAPCIVESTANGPGGLYHSMALTARRSPEWAFLFFPWYRCEDYARAVPEDFEATDEELEQLKLYPEMTMENIVWRRWKIVDEGYGNELFAKEYPVNPEDPFLLTGERWFCLQTLRRMAAMLRSPSRRVGFLRVYTEPEKGRRYFVGMDTSGGVKKDWGAVVVLRDDLTVVAVWVSNTVRPHAQADAAADVADLYGRARVLCEKNKYGKAVIKRMTELGVRLWKDKNGNDFWTQGGRAGMTKKMIYDFAERVIKAGWVTCPDQDLHSELQHIREQEGGAIEADSGYHDDLADAFCLALWNARKHIRYDGDEDVTRRIAKQKRERANNPLGY